jgi:hypothetical protein
LVSGTRYSRPAARLGAIGAREREGDRYAKTIMGTGVWGKANPEKHAKSSMGTSIWAKLSYKNIAKPLWEQVFLGS